MMRNENNNGMHIPDDFQSALALDGTASVNFSALPDSHKMRYVGHIDAAAGAEERMRRIDAAVRMLGEGKPLR